MKGALTVVQVRAANTKTHQLVEKQMKLEFERDQLMGYLKASVLPMIGQRMVPIAGVRKPQRRRALPCPFKACARHARPFYHPLHWGRHMSTTHGMVSKRKRKLMMKKAVA